MVNVRYGHVLRRHVHASYGSCADGSATASQRGSRVRRTEVQKTVGRSGRRKKDVKMVSLFDTNFAKIDSRTSRSGDHCKFDGSLRGGRNVPLLFVLRLRCRGIRVSPAGDECGKELRPRGGGVKGKRNSGCSGRTG